MADQEEQGPARIVFTTLFRHDLAEAMGYDSNSHIPGNSTKQRLAFLKSIDWDDPRNMDKAVRSYLGWVVSAVCEKLQEGRPPMIHISWGSPSLDKGGKLRRPQMRVMVHMEDTPEESYILSFTPARQQNAMLPETRKALDMIRQTIERDMGMAIAEPALHAVPAQSPVTLEPDANFAKNNPLRYEMRNLYEGEGATWDLQLPAGELAERLKEVIRGGRDISRAHVPHWYS